MIEIPAIHLPVLLHDVYREIGNRWVSEGKLNRADLSFTPPAPWSIRHKVALTLLDLITGTDSIISNLNFAINQMNELPHLNGISREEKLDRLQLLVRLYLYEFARMEDVYSHFLASLNRLDRISKQEKRRFRKFFYDQFEPFIKGRNNLIHRVTDLPKDEAYLLFYSTRSERHGRDPNMDRASAKFDNLLSLAARKRAIVMRLEGFKLTEFVQLTVDTMALLYSEAGRYGQSSETDTKSNPLSGG